MTTALLGGIHVRTTTMASIALSFIAGLAAPRLASAQPTAGEDSQHILTVDHYVPNQSIVPSIDGPNRADLRARAREAGDDPARRAARRSRRAVRARRRHAGRGRVRRAVRRLQLDGVSRRRGLRRVLDGHDGLRPLDAAERHERGLQSLGRAADGARRARRAKRRTARSSRRSRRTGTTSTPSSSTSARCATCRA